MKIAVRDLLPNPYRHLERYPIIESKVENLVASIDQTSFWDNLLARKSVDKPGKFELAYGVHRREALKRARISEIDIPVRALDDATMIKIMANENMEEWGHSASIEQETVRAVVEGYAKGKFELAHLPQNSKGTRFEAASDQPFKALVGSKTDSSGSMPYTVESIIEFLGWKRYKVETAMAALSMISDNLVDEKTLAGLRSRQAKVVTDEISHVLKETQKPELAKAVGKRLAAGMRQSVSGHDRAGNERNVKDVTIHNARAKTNEMIKPHVRPKEKKVPDISKFVPALVQQMSELPTERLKEKIEAIIPFRGDVHQKDLRMLIGALRGVAKRFERLAERLEG